MKKKVVLAAMLLITVLASSCSDDDDDVVVPQAAYVSVINALAGSQPLDFFLDENQTNNNGIRYGDGRDYISAFTGERRVTFRETGSVQSILTDTVTLENEEYYSLFLAGAIDKPELIFLHDTITQPARGNAAVRFVNLSADAGPVDLVIKQGPVLASGRNYKEYTSFTEVQGYNRYTIEVREAGTASVLASITNAELRGNSVYTVWLQGFKNSDAGHILQARIILNALYFN